MKESDIEDNGFLFGGESEKKYASNNESDPQTNDEWAVTPNQGEFDIAHIFTMPYRLHWLCHMNDSIFIYLVGY